MRLGSVISGLAQAAVLQLSRMMTSAAAASDGNHTKRDLIRVCSIVRHFYRGNAEMRQVCCASAAQC